MLKIVSNSVDETKKLGYLFAKYLIKGDVVVLNGELGSGKTAFVTGFMSYYGRENDVSSPTFTIVNEHELSNGTSLFHFDVYRLENEDEFYAIGGEEYFDKGISFIEWGNIVKNALPKEYIEIKISSSLDDENQRIFEFIPYGEHYQKIIVDLKEDNNL